jgi:hypothetical protein
MSEPCGGSPEWIYSKESFRCSFGVGRDRARGLQAYIVAKKWDHAKAGKSIIAPLSVWYQALKECPDGFGSKRK